MDNDSKNFIKQRTFEISWAVFRVAVLVRQPKLKIELENAAIDLLVKPIEVQLQYIEKLEQLVKLAEKIGEIKSINADVLYRELGNLQTVIEKVNGKSIRQVQGKRQLPDVEIESIFSKPPMIIDKNNSINTSTNTSIFSANKSKRQIHSAILSQTANGNVNGNSYRQTANIERKSIILKNIQKSSENLQFKDLIGILSGISERTVRNDIQQLCDEGAIERVGGGGPHSYYRLATSH